MTNLLAALGDELIGGGMRVSLGTSSAFPAFNSLAATADEELRKRASSSLPVAFRKENHR